MSLWLWSVRSKQGRESLHYSITLHRCGRPCQRCWWILLIRSSYWHDDNKQLHSFIRYPIVTLNHWVHWMEMLLTLPGKWSKNRRFDRKLLLIINAINWIFGWMLVGDFTHVFHVTSKPTNMFSGLVIDWKLYVSSNFRTNGFKVSFVNEWWFERLVNLVIGRFFFIHFRLMELMLLGKIIPPARKSWLALSNPIRLYQQTALKSLVNGNWLS